MESIVKSIVDGCAAQGVEVAEAMAAFMARVIVENDPVRFAPDREISDDSLEQLTLTAIERLTEADAPAMETLKMQVAFDSTYQSCEDRLEMEKKRRVDEKQRLIREILNVRPKSATDYEALTGLYRRIYSFLVKVSTGDEREIAAALESVFPRVGLKSFVQLSSDAKRGQLEELALIVLGIRLFNREVGKGGVGLDRVEEKAMRCVCDLQEILDHETNEQNDLASRYQDTLVYCHLRGVALDEVERWGQELANRRQYAAYLQSLAEDAAACARRVAARREKFKSELDDLKRLVGGRASVPKEQVYPKFEAIASAYGDLREDLDLVEARTETLEALHAFRESFVPTLLASHPVARAARLDRLDKKNIVEDQADMAAAALREEEEELKAAARGAATGASAVVASDDEPAQPQDDDDDDEPREAAAVLLSVETTPEFLQLPLEYQGFCGWTVANRQGLLLPGKPALGVVRYQGACYVFAHAVALRAFMRNPDAVKQAVLDAGAKAPELVHLLRIQDQYPGTSIAHVLADRAHNKKSAAAGPRAPTKDAATDTPTHFVEKHIDYAYDWNEWGLRRRALRLAQLKTCATTSVQTDKSHFRRDNHSQVYLPRVKPTQTRTDSSTNLPVHVQYLAGLRGGPNHKTKPGVVNLSFEV